MSPPSLRHPRSQTRRRTLPLAFAFASMLSSSFMMTPADSHGFLSTPRSRNLVAYEDRKYHDATDSDPLPEDCPTCINRGGTLARCGVLNPGVGGDEERNYDFPRNALGDPMPANPQAVYEVGSVVDVEVTLSAHHRGHFVFKACPVPSTSVSPSQECFDEHPLEFVEDMLYGAPKDEGYPHRAYVAPEHVPNRVTSRKDGFDTAMVFRYKMRLPPGLVGELVLMQWYYVAGNSGCAHAGYADYPWPEDWILELDEDEGSVSDWESKFSVGTGLVGCEEGGVIPPDGNGVPEQFWNCAEVTIVPEGELPPEFELGQIETDKTIIGYLASWQWYDRNKFAEPWVFDYRKYTRINFAFFQTNVQGDLWGTDSWADPNLLFGPYNWNGIEGVDPKYCSWDKPNKKVCMHHHYEKGVMHLARQAGCEIWPSIGGWSLSDPFPAMAINPAARTRFAEQCVELIEEYGFDGIDIDWEYPGYEAHSGTPDDTLSYNLLLREVREKLDALGQKNDRFYGLTAALPCGTNHINNIDIPTAAGYLSELNLMTYDFFGAWSPTTGANAPLFDQDWGEPEVDRFSVDGCVRNWIEAGGSPEKINIGLPFYGRGFLKAKHLNEEHEGKPDTGVWWQDDGSPQYFNIVEKLPNLVSVRHEMTKTQYAYNDTIVNGVEVGGMVSYDDEEAICDKTQYCLDYNLNGFIIWEISGDLMADGSTPLIDAVHAKLQDPSIDCSQFAYDKATFSDYKTPFGHEIALAKPIIPGADDETTKRMECPSVWFWGIVPWDDCKSYFTCSNGTPDMSTFTECDEGELFDETSQLCKEESLVTCSLLEDSSATDSAPQEDLDLVLDEPAAFSGFTYDTDCSNDASWVAGPECTSYYRCLYGNVVTPITACQPGTLFDEKMGLCNYEALVSCDKTFSPTAGPTPKLTSQTSSNIVEPVQEIATLSPPRPATPQMSKGVSKEMAAPQQQRPTTPQMSKEMVAPQPSRPTPNIQNKQVVTPPTPKPTPRRTPPPSQYPTPKPTKKPFDVPAPTPPYEIIPTEPSRVTFDQEVPRPTNRPSRRPRTPRPTRQSVPEYYTSLASSFLAAPKPSPSYIDLIPSKPSLVLYSRPSKGEEMSLKEKKDQKQANRGKKTAKKGKRGGGGKVVGNKKNKSKPNRKPKRGKNGRKKRQKNSRTKIQMR